MHRICTFFCAGSSWKGSNLGKQLLTPPPPHLPPPLPPRPLGAYHILLSFKHLFVFSKQAKELNNFTQQHETPSQPSNSYLRTYLVEGRGLLEEVGEARPETRIK